MKRRSLSCGATVEPDGTVRGMDFAGLCGECRERLSINGGAHVPDEEPPRMLCRRCCTECGDQSAGNGTRRSLRS